MKHTILVTMAVLLAAPTAWGADCSLQIAANDQMQFDRRELMVPSTCAEIEVSLMHSGKAPIAALAHDWVLARTSDVAALAAAGISAGAAHNYLPLGDSRIIAATQLVQGGASTSVRFPATALKNGGDYTFFCSSPGHSSMMKGKFLFGGKADRLVARNN